MAVLNEGEVALQQASDYYEAISTRDIKDVDDVRRSPVKADALLKSYARHIGTPAANATILANINRGDAKPMMSIDTLVDYVEALKKIYVIEELEAWNPNFRSKASARTSPTRHFVDPSIATAALHMSPEDLLNDIRTCGFFFESLCVRDLRVYADSLKGQVFHYLDNTGLEVDAVIHLNDGRWGAIEVKLGSDEIRDATRNLISLKNKIDTIRMREPSFLMVLTGTEYAYRNEEGVWIVPVGCLKD